jgi:hypothetical protein
LCERFCKTSSQVAVARHFRTPLQNANLANRNAAIHDAHFVRQTEKLHCNFFARGAQPQRTMRGKPHQATYSRNINHGVKPTVMIRADSRSGLLVLRYSTLSLII